MDTSTTVEPTTQPVGTTADPIGTTMEPSEPGAIMAPGTMITLDPTIATIAPTATTMEPTITTPEPTITEITAQPTIIEPVMPPVMMILDQSIVTNEPTAITSEPTPTTSEPTAITSQPTIITSEPTIIITSEPTAEPSTEPSVMTAGPTVATPEPSTEPTFATAGPTVATPEPSALPSFFTANPTEMTNQPTIATMTPTNLPSFRPSPSTPSNSPSTAFPSFPPTDGPSGIPSLSLEPSFSPSASRAPTKSEGPSQSFPPSTLPTRVPSVNPTNFPSRLPSVFPSMSFFPSLEPSASSLPSRVPTESPQPTATPSDFPSFTPRPTPMESSSPSDIPTEEPSVSPTIFPTFLDSQQELAFYSQILLQESSSRFSVNDVAAFETVMEEYTPSITQGDQHLLINTSCTFIIPSERILVISDTVFGHLVEFSMLWESRQVSVTDVPADFLSFINGNRDLLIQDLQEVGINITNANNATRLVETPSPSSAPTLSIFPSFLPSTWPSVGPSSVPSEVASSQPTSIPSDIPSMIPSTSPSGRMPSMAPSSIPSTTPPSMQPSERPTPMPTQPPSSGVSTTVIAVLSILGGGIVLVGLFFFFKQRKRRKEQEYQAAVISRTSDQPNTGRRHSKPRINIKTKEAHARRDYDTPKSDDNVVGMISPSDSLLSNQSLLSAGNSVGGETVAEQDGRHHLRDEFDDYKDQNLEIMRTEVEGTLTGADGMISKAMTLAFISDEEIPADPNELYWGGGGDPTEIEASALCEVNDWLKKNESASLEERRAFMQDTMNKMVASVRHGVVEPAQASHTIHECAAMLGLELATEIPETTLIITGMRKTVTKTDVIVGFRQFGEIEDAAVSSNSRGFGLVRFISPKSVQRAINKFRKEEIVVQDVAVMIKVLKSDGNGKAMVAHNHEKMANSSAGAEA